MVLQSNSTSCPQPFLLLEVVNDQLVVEAFAVLTLKTHTSYDDHVVFVDLD
jgi:hypothetical protein